MKLKFVDDVKIFSIRVRYYKLFNIDCITQKFEKEKTRTFITIHSIIIFIQTHFVVNFLQRIFNALSNDVHSFDASKKKKSLYTIFKKFVFTSFMNLIHS